MMREAVGKVDGEGRTGWEWQLRLNDESGRLQRAVSFFGISPQRTKAQGEEDKQMKMESCGGSLHDDFSVA